MGTVSYSPMASLYQRKVVGETSPYWWIKYRDPATFKIKQETTKYRIGVGRDTRLARQLEAEYTCRERTLPRTSKKEGWDMWVTAFLKLRYHSSEQSKLRYLTAWRNVRMFLNESRITVPRQLKREHCTEYFIWRGESKISEGKYRAGHNTALLEIKLLGIIMDEAVTRRYAPFNPCHRLGIKRAKAKAKPEFNREILTAIEAAWDKEPEPRRTFLKNSFLIARYQGCRIAETQLNPMADVALYSDGNSGQITLHTKGGKIHTVNLHPKLVPLFRELQASGATTSYPQPKSPSKDWFNFLTRHHIKSALPGACFHSLRVTAATQLARKGVSEKKAMSYIGHASTTIHRTYVHFRTEDLSDCTDALD